MSATLAETTAPSTAKDLEQTWRKRIEQARDAQKPFVKTWLSNLAFAAGQHWLVWDDRAKRLRNIADLDSSYRGRQLYTADRINEYRQAQLGELNADDDRPQLLTAQSGNDAEEIAKQLNHAVGYAWQHEWGAQAALQQARRYTVDLGVAAVRCRWDPDKGPVEGHLPMGEDGKPTSQPDVLAHLEQYGQMPDGSLPQFKQVREGRTCWEAYSSFQILVPPGVNHEAQFPWEILARPVPLDDLIAQYPAAEGLTEDTDIASAMGLSTGQTVRDLQSQGNSGTRLRGHVWLYTCFQRPNAKNPNGQKVLIAGSQFRLIDQPGELEYQLPDGTPHSGVVYLHWWRLNDRFYSRSFVEPLKDPQRAVNTLETFKAEIVMRGGPKVFLHEGDLIDSPEGVPLEVIRMAANATPPMFHQGVGPGDWMNVEKAGHIDNLAHASTLSAVQLGENPPNVNTYSQLALLNENEAGKRSVIVTDHKQQIATLVTLGIQDMRQRWPEQKQIMVAGDQDEISEQTFAKSQIPTFFTVKVAQGAPQPRSQAAELKKIDAIWAAAIQCGLAVQNNIAWGKWYVDSVQAGQAQDIPDPPQDSQAEVAMFENFLMRDQNQVPAPADHDLSAVHVPIHREALDQARAAGDDQAAQRIQQHIDLSVQMVAAARKTWRVYDPSDVADTGSDLALDEDQALRENNMLIQGIPVNPEQLQQAITQVQQGINPETGAPLTPADNLQQILEKASLQPTLVENLQLHLDRHGKVIKSAAFQTVGPDARRRFLTHFDLTRQLWLSIPQMPDKIESPKISLSLREEVGPSTTAKILARGGVPEADPNQIATEPVLPNMVQANVSEPDPIQSKPTNTN